MKDIPTSTEAKQSLNAHVAEKGREVHEKYGSAMGWKTLEAMMQDREVVRYPCRISFTNEGLMEGEFAYPHPLGNRPEDGFEIRVHPVFMTELSQVSHLVLYQLVAVNYGDFASIEDAETFGAAALGVDRESYYLAVCDLADRVAGCGCG